MTRCVNSHELHHGTYERISSTSVAMCFTLRACYCTVAPQGKHRKNRRTVSFLGAVMITPHVSLFVNSLCLFTFAWLAWVMT